MEGVPCCCSPEPPPVCDCVDDQVESGTLSVIVAIRQDDHVWANPCGDFYLGREYVFSHVETTYVEATIPLSCSSGTLFTVQPDRLEDGEVYRVSATRLDHTNRIERVLHRTCPPQPNLCGNDWTRLYTERTIYSGSGTFETSVLGSQPGRPCGFLGGLESLTLSDTFTRIYAGSVMLAVAPHLRDYLRSLQAPDEEPFDFDPDSFYRLIRFDVSGSVAGSWETGWDQIYFCPTGSRPPESSSSFFDWCVGFSLATPGYTGGIEAWSEIGPTCDIRANGTPLAAFHRGSSAGPPWRPVGEVIDYSPPTPIDDCGILGAYAGCPDQPREAPVRGTEQTKISKISIMTEWSA